MEWIDMRVHLRLSVGARSRRTDQETAAGSLQTDVLADRPCKPGPREIAILRMKKRLVASGIY
ncbi:hypothetical protein [Paraburkholderia diazotrophica]|uniref:hypothetical protein n=1 Tax=Paraburkholderia diazotrophica TaxID=667676 RepID=UPI00115FDD51|nr:hypothetical protein [Paraburkholderia diazotrophica]